MKRVFRLPGTRRRLDDELEQEFRFHLEGRIEDLMEREGLSRDDAERDARRRFGDYEAHQREARTIDGTMLQRRGTMDLADTVRRETRRAARTLLRSPGFSIIAVTTLALGLASATTIFTLLDRVVLRPLPYPNAGRLMHIGTLWPKVKAGEEYALSKGQYFYFKKHSTALADLLLYDTDFMVVPGDGDHPAERASELDVSANTFALLGIRPQLGHVFTAADELNPDGDRRVVLLSHDYWQRRFGGDPNIVGKRISLGDRSVEIIGVLPASAKLPNANADVWTRNYLDPSIPPQNNHSHRAIGLLEPGVTVQAALADLRRVQAAMQREYPDVYSAAFLARSGFAMSASSLRDAVLSGTVARALWLMFAAVAFVLLIAAANVANLFLVRLEARRREMAVRTALGAGRLHLAVHFLAESMLIAVVAAAGAVALAYGLLHLVLAIAPHSLPRLDEVAIDWRGIGFCVVTALAFGAAFGLAPVASAGVNVLSLRDGGRGLTTSRARDVSRRGLVLSQVALAVVLLSGAALMAKSFVRLRGVRPGFDATGVTSMTITLSPARFRNAPDVVAFWRDLTSRIESIPGVARAGASGTLPLADAGGCSGILTDVVETGRERGNCMPMTIVTPGYFEAMGIEVNGTLPTWSSVQAHTAPTIVTAAFAKRFWGDQQAIGRGIKPFDDRFPYYTVAGIAGDIRAQGLQNAPIEEAYFPIVGPPGNVEWFPWRRLHFVVRAPTLPHSRVVTAVRQVVAQIDPQVPIADILPMEEVVARSTAQTSFTMLLLLLSATIALTLSAVGIYGVISFVVGQRRGEIGIRMALGAQAAEVARLVVGESLAVAGAGVVVGLGAALLGTRLLRTLLFEVSPTDPLILAATAAASLIVATLASIAPTRRATRIDPIEAMRT